ncbi:DMT family transporter [Streptomyces sp. ICBB 8177]|uniref:DMT family transporter n=1 Tax=Streptomyces sp. ICBB 8177 TaxID=563922 RepID=UPI000D673403|nr:DMT family transporter [Streptomyces sp. ICBB 8177]PWI41236.1 hypothetical protein CK485_26435 [Streptomyces sp. ICBB 8177]
MLTYVLALLAACANAAASVLQRKANRGLGEHGSLSLTRVAPLLRDPVWICGFLAVIAGFVLQAAALTVGALAVVEPVLVCELPLALLLASRVFHGRLHRREWACVLGMTAGLAVMLYFLAPAGGDANRVSPYVWLTAVLLTLAVAGGTVAWGRRAESAGDDPASGSRAAAAFGVAAGSLFGLAAALMKGAMSRYTDGFTAILTAWQLYAMAVTGLVAMFLLQSAMHAGRLLAAQPGLTLSDPLLSVLWGVLVFGENVRGGWNTAFALLGAALIVASVLVLARSPLLTVETEETAPRARAEDAAARRT